MKCHKCPSDWEWDDELARPVCKRCRYIDPRAGSVGNKSFDRWEGPEYKRSWGLLCSLGLHTQMRIKEDHYQNGTILRTYAACNKCGKK